MFKAFYQEKPSRFWLYIIGAVLVPVLSIFNTFLVQQETNIILTKNWHNFIMIEVLTFTIMLVTYGLGAWVRYLMTVQEQDFDQDMRLRIVSHYYRDGQEHSVSSMQNRLTNDLKLINQNYFDMIYGLIYGIMMIVSVLFYLILLNWQLLLVIVLMTAVSLLLPKIIEKPLQKATQMISSSNERYLDTLNDWLGGLAQIQQFLAGDKLFKVTSQAAKKLEDSNVKQTAYTKLLTAVNGIVSAIFGVILFLLTGYLIKNGQVTIGTLLVVGNFRYYLNGGINSISNARGAMKGTKQLMSEVELSAEPVNEKQEINLQVPKTIKTEDLSLQFPNGEKLNFPDITIKSGEKILLTGDSGAGKSTLFKLILGELKPSSGRVIFENDEGQAIQPDLTKLGYIPQDPIVFPATIQDNITMFNGKLDQQVDEMIAEVNLKADITKFKDGKNEEINLDNLNISGGQRQKIVLARAKIHDSEIILIDEGTSAIDQKNTMDILQKLVKTPATIVFIAHNFNAKMKDLFDREIHLVKG